MKKTAIITGGTKGIGRAIVEKFLAEGFAVITCARNKEELEELAEISEDIHIFQADLSKKKEVLSFASFIKNKAKSIDVLVNNTGVFLPGEIHKEPEGNLELMMNTNVYSAYHLTRALVDVMINQSSGHIFTICSVASIKAYEQGGSYSISKFALLGMNKVLREELKPYNIRVTSLLPGATYTNSWEGAGIPKERFMESSDIAIMLWAAYSLSKGAVVEEILLRPQLGDI